MPALNRGTLILQTRKELIETGTTSGQWDDTELTEFLQEANEAVTEIAEQELVATAQTVAGQETVDYPATVGTIKGIWVRRNGTTAQWVKLRKADIDERLPDSTAAERGAPSAYLIFAGKMYLLPIPDNVYDLNIFCYQAASDMVGGTDATLPIFNSKFHVLLRHYAVARAKQKMDDPGYVNYDALFIAGVTGFRVAKEAAKNTEGPVMPKIVSGMWD